ncbi:MAG: hypothetical protein CMC08_03900 [Flavobacteriaceae bacterium]|nr:hypothetical protein [Flavobacteriaceae bacterium]
MNFFSFLLPLLLFVTLSGTAQIENPTVRLNIEAIEDDFSAPTGLELPATRAPNLTIPKDPFEPKMDTSLGQEEPAIQFGKDDGLMDNISNKAPKYFTKDKEAKEEFGSDQNLGRITTKGHTVNVVYRDHQYVDGDVIRVYVNDDIVQSRISLRGSFHGFDLPLQEGINRIEFEALNQGSSGPNTAELHVYDDKGQLVSAKEWNLLTGYKATIVVFKEE